MEADTDANADSQPKDAKAKAEGNWTQILQLPNYTGVGGVLIGRNCRYAANHEWFDYWQALVRRS